MASKNKVEHKMLFKHRNFVISQTPHDRISGKWSSVFLCNGFETDRSTFYCDIVTSVPMDKNRLISIADNFTRVLQSLKGDTNE